MPDNDDLLNSRLWILQLLPEKLPGKIIKTWGKGHCRIRCLIDELPLSDGSHVTSFIGFGHDVKLIDNNRSSLEIGDHVLFSWDSPGERSKDKNGQEGDPKAVEIEVINVELAEQIASEIGEITEIDNLRNRLIEYNKVAKQNIQEKCEDVKKIQEECEELKQTYEKLKSDIHFCCLDEIQEKLQDIQEQYQKIEDIKALQNKQQEDLEKQAKQLEPYRSLLPESEEDEEINKSQLVDLPENFGYEWTNQLQDNGLYVTKQIANSYLISIFSALYLGRLVLLNGTVGVGKTSIIKHSATLLGGKSNIIPVRPAWLDPSDLLGFYDPLQEIFRPAPFLSALSKANKNTSKIHLVCLDELNLAKIENYASDVLSQLEYSRKNRDDGLILYSEDIWENLEEECQYLHGKEDFKSRQRLKIIQNLFKNYPEHKFSIPQNLVLLGTLNSDETTYDLSPKLIDRSFIITYPPANLKVDFAKKSDSDGQSHQSISTQSIVDKIESCQNTIFEEQEVTSNWEIIVEWNKLYFCEYKLGRPLGYRVREDYRIFSAVGKLLGLQPNECFGYFVFTKILPRIYFFKEDEKNAQFQQWLQQLEKYREYDDREDDLGKILDNLQQQSNPENQQIQLVNYFGGSR